MRGNLVALDLETTGLDIHNDAIIEIGAVRLREGAILDEYKTFINPGFVIPSETTHITGIHQDDLRHAPLLTDVLGDVAQFVGDAPVIAHNVEFDMGFMRRFGILTQNVPIDTYDLASILLPRVPRYSLSSLTALLDIDLENAHRALDDARATALLYWRLWEKTLTLPAAILHEIATLTQQVDWSSGTVFRAAWHECQGEDGVKSASVTVEDTVFSPLHDDVTPLKAHDVLNSIAMTAIDAVLDEGGSLSNKLLHYEHRQEQIMMAQSIAHAFNESQHLLIEAGTGTGKSLGYLVPAFLWAHNNQQRVVISTNTINLQEQLLQHDVPILQDALQQPIRAVVMKGRSNYLCPRRLASMRRKQAHTADEVRTLAKILVWLQESQSGDRGEINLRHDEHFAWQRLSAQDEECALHRCQSQMAGTCPYYKARQQAEAAHLVIVNHALLVSDAASDHGVLPNYQYLIVDEAHQLENAITHGMSMRVDQSTLLRRLGDLGGITTGSLGTLLNHVRLSAAPKKHVMRLEGFVQNVSDVVKATQVYVRRFFEAAYQFIQDSHNDNAYRIRLDSKRRGHGAFQSVKRDWQQLAEYFDVLIDALQQLATAMDKLEKYAIAHHADHIHAISSTARHLDDLRQTMQACINDPDANQVYWINNGNAAHWISLQSAPLHIGQLMEQTLWHTKQAIILTSATLRTGSSFDFLRERLYAEGSQEIALGSPFDYKQSTLVLIPEDVPQPNERGYQQAIERSLIDLAVALDGRVLALFTSYSQLRETAANISPRLALGNIAVYDQATGGSREALLDRFKSTEKAILLGTRSFWEGVDIPGDDLVALAIVRLPFSVPNDPIFAARSNTYSHPFNEYAIPDAILRFRQGFGRLIRTKTDRGIVAVLDSRIIHKSYGMKFLESLPDVNVDYGRVEDLGNRAASWFNDTKESSS